MNNNLSGLSALALRTSIRVTADNTATGVDVSEFQGVCQVILNSGAPEEADDTLDVKLQHCDTIGGTYTDVTGGAFAQVTFGGGASLQTLTLNADNFKKFVRVFGDTGGGTPAMAYGVTLHGVKQRS